MGKTKEEVKILIVDDDEKALKLLELKLLELGFRSIFKERRGTEALETAKKHPPDLIFLDIIMPGLDGGKVRERLIENPATKDIPVVFVSSIIDKEEEKRIGGRLSGGEIIVSKPYSSDEILKAIEKTL
jgi:twitching motility two-component system response regulator PilH